MTGRDGCAQGHGRCHLFLEAVSDGHAAAYGILAASPDGTPIGSASGAMAYDGPMEPVWAAALQAGTGIAMAGGYAMMTLHGDGRVERAVLEADACSGARACSPVPEGWTESWWEGARKFASGLCERAFLERVAGTAAP